MVAEGTCSYGDHLVMHINVESLCGIPETNMSAILQ